MSENRDYLEMAFRSVQCFGNDGKLNVDELQKLTDIALRDGVVDDNEKRVLRKIIGLLNPDELSPAMLGKIESLRAAVGI